MGVGASGATLEIQLVADVARLKRDMAAMQDTIASTTASAGKSFAGMSAQTVNSAAQMAAAAQASARAAVGMAAGIKTAHGSMQNANIVTMELFHVTRSLTEQLAMGVSPARAFGMEIGRIATAVQYSGGSVKGLIGQFAAFAGIIKVTQNAELAEAAAQKAALAAAVQSRAERAAGALVARQAQVAIAQAQLAAATTAEAEAAAQAQLVAALRAVELAAGKAAIAQRALAGAEAEATEAAAASAAASRTMIGGSAVGLIGIGTIALVAFGAIKKFQDEVRDSGALNDFAEGLRLTDAQIKKAGGSVTYLGHNIREIHGLTVTFGDVAAGVFEELRREAGDSTGWDTLKGSATSAFSTVLDVWNKTSAAISAGLWTLGDIAKDVFQFIGQQIGKGFFDGVNKAVDALNALNARIPKWAGGGDPNLIPHLQVAPGVSTLGDLGATIRKQADKNYADALAANKKAYAGIENAALAHRKRMFQIESDSNNPPKPPHERKKSDHGLAEALAELDAAIRGQLNLANAYLVSDAAAIKATALQKAEEDAIKHKSQTGVFYELELQKAVATGAAEGAKQVAHMRDETAARKAVNDNLAAGTLSYRDMNEAMQDQTALQPLLVLQSIATGDAYKAVTAVIEAYRHELQAAHEEEHRSQALAELGRLNEQHKETMALLQRESDLTGVQKDKRDEILKLLKLEKDLRAQFPGMTEQEIQKIVQETAAEDALRKHLDQVEAGMDQLRQTGENMIDTVFNIDNWKDPLDLALQLVKQLEQSFVTLAFANPLKNMLYGENLPTLDSVGGVGGFFKGIAGGGKSAQAMLSTAGTTLNTAGTGLNTAALALQTAAEALSAAAAASGVGGAASGAGGLFGALFSGGPGIASAGMDFSNIGAGLNFGTDFAALPPLTGLASGGWRPIGGMGGGDRNILSINWNPIARVGSDEHLAVIPRGAANSNQANGDTYHIHVTPQPTGDRAKDRQTAMQWGADIESGIASRRRKGMI